MSSNKNDMIPIDEKIINFIKEHHVLTFAMASVDDIWCANAFYALVAGLPGLVITSDIKTRHIQTAFQGYEDGAENPVIAGSIVLETEVIGLIRGVQFKAEIKEVDNSLLSKYRLLYLKRFPYAILKDNELWILEFTELKYTDNRLGFGKKLLWKR